MLVACLWMIKMKGNANFVFPILVTKSVFMKMVVTLRTYWNKHFYCHCDIQSDLVQVSARNDFTYQQASWLLISYLFNHFLFRRICARISKATFSPDAVEAGRNCELLHGSLFLESVTLWLGGHLTVTRRAFQCFLVSVFKVRVRLKAEMRLEW